MFAQRPRCFGTVTLMLQRESYHAAVLPIRWLMSIARMTGLDFAGAGDVIRMTVRVDGVQQLQLQLL